MQRIRGTLQCGKYYQNKKEEYADKLKDQEPKKQESQGGRNLFQAISTIAACSPVPDSTG